MIKMMMTKKMTMNATSKSIMTVISVAATAIITISSISAWRAGIPC